MAKAKKSTLVCRPCAYGVTVSDLGSAVVECWECGMELVPEKAAAAEKLIAARKALPAKKAAAKKPAARKAGKRITRKR